MNSKFRKWFCLLIEPKHISYKNRHKFLNLILVVSIILFLTLTAEDLIFKRFGIIIFESFSGLVFTSTLYYFSRFRKVFIPTAVVFFAFMLLVFLSLSLGKDGESNILSFFFILYVVAVVFIFEGKWRLFFLVLAFGLAAVLSVQGIFYSARSSYTNVSVINQNLAFLFVAFILVLFISFALNRYRIEKQIVEDLSKIDYLTGLFNRREGMERFNYLVNYLKREEKRLSLIMMDIDDFKKVNDRYGHICGDMVLKKVASIIRSNIRQTDIAIRWGGEEFLIILPNAGKREAFSIAERIRKEIEKEEFKCDGNLFHVTITGGIASYNFGKSIKKNIASADEALYEGKREGKNRNIIA